MKRRRFCAGLVLLVAAPTALLAAAQARGRSSGTIAAGTPWATPYFVQDTGVSGPTVLIVGGVHGNEPAGARAAAQIRHWTITRGKLIVIPRANEPALREGSRLMPTAEDRDLNRSFPRAADDPPRGELATALWGVVRQTRPTWLIDLHESLETRRQNKKKVGNSIVYHPAPASKAQALRMLEAVNAGVSAPDRKFVLLRPPAKGSLARAAAERLGARAMLLETTRRGQPLSLRVRQHRLMVRRFLLDLKMLSGGPDVLFPLGRKRGEIRVAIYDAGGTGKGAGIIEGKLEQLRRVRVERVGPPEILEGALQQFDVLIVPGGGASRQARAITPEGREAIRRFVRNGGGYWGSCAGAYLAASNYTWSLHILDAKVIDRAHWKRGKGIVKIELTPEGRRILGDRTGQIDIRYANGPLLAPAGRPDIPDFTPLALFRGEIAENGAPKGVMINTPAIVAGRWGRGRVLVSSPHLEYSKGLESFVERAVRWAAGR